MISQTLLSTIIPWMLTVALVSVLLIFLIQLKSLIKNFLIFNIKTKLILIIIITLSSFVRFFFVPNDHRIYYDEDRYLSYAVTFARFGKALSIEMATPNKSIIGAPDKVARLTVPVINGLSLKLFGYSEKTLFNTARIFSIFQILLIFILTQLLLGNINVSLISTFIFAFLPTPVFWSVSTALDNYFVFFSLLSFISVQWFAKKGGAASGILMCSSIFLLLFVRFEAVLFLLILIHYARFEQKNKILNFIKTNIVFIIILLIIVFFRIAVSLAVYGQKWCCADALPLEVFSPNYILRNILPNFQSLFTLVEFPFILTLLSLRSIFSKKERENKILGFWLILFFTLYSFYYAGVFFTYEFSGSYGRYLLMLISPFVILAAISLNDFLKKKIILLIVFITIIPTLLNYQRLIKLSPYDRLVEAGPRILHQFLTEKIIAKTPKDAIIIHNLTAPILLYGKTSIFINIFFTDDKTIDFVVNSLKRKKPVFMLETFQCSVFPERCNKINKYFKFITFLKDDKTGMELVKIELK